MSKKATFYWRDLYLRFVQQFEPTATDTNLKTIRIRRNYGTLTIAEKQNLDLRETGGKREIVKAIFKSAQGFVVLTTQEGHVVGSVYEFQSNSQ